KNRGFPFFPRGAGKPVTESLKIDRGGGSQMLQVGLGYSYIACTPQTKGSYTLRDSRFDSRSYFVFFFELLRLFTRTRLLECLMERFRFKSHTPLFVLGLGTLRSAFTMLAIDLGKHGVYYFIAPRIDHRFPISTLLPHRTSNRLAFPINMEMRDIKA